jgi:hypothetical protein
MTYRREEQDEDIAREVVMGLSTTGRVVGRFRTSERSFRRCSQGIMFSPLLLILVF